MIPHEKALVERLKNEPFALIGINTDRDLEKYRGDARKHGVGWRNSIQGGTDGPLCRAWKVRRYPTIYVLDHEGVIRYQDVQYRALDQAVDRLLAEARADLGQRR